MKIKTAHIFIKQEITTLPPIINLIYYFLDNKFEVNLISTGKPMDGVEVNNYTVSQKRNNLLLKVVSWLTYRKFFKSYKKCIKNNDIVWIGSADAAMAIGQQNLKNIKYFLHVHELYDDNFVYKTLLKPYMVNSFQNIVPEINRAYIFKTWYKLKKVPFVIPNKPYNNIIIEKNDFIQKKLDIIRTQYKYLFVYQGMLSYKRDILPFINIFHEHGLVNNMCLVLLGPIYEKDLSDKINISKNIFYLGEVAAPNHLSVTKECDFGILTYSYVNLNNLYCAPNKIWEYTKFGLPILSNYLMGLQFLFSNDQKFGLSIKDLDDQRVLLSSIKELINNKEDYSRNALDFYKSLNLNELYSFVLKNKGK